MRHKLAYILNHFPHGDVPIVNELKVLSGAKINVEIIAVRQQKKFQSLRLSQKTDYPVKYLFDSKGGYHWWRFVIDNAHTAIRYPLRYGAAAARSITYKGENFKLACLFVRALRTIRPTLVYVNWSWATCGSVMFACRILRLPFIFSVRGTDITPPACNFALRVKTAKRILTPSKGYAEILENELRVPGNKIRVVPDCPSFEDFIGVKPTRNQINGPLRLISVGTLRPVKRHEDLIRCCSILRQDGIAFECCIFGDGPSREKLQALNHELRLDDCVLLAGNIPRRKLAKEFECSDIYVHTSERESFCHAVIEAQASARPVVVADAIGGIRDSVLPGKTAIMVPVGRPQELATAIMELAKDPTVWVRMGQAGREFVMKNFSYERFGPNFLKALFGE